MKLDILEKLIRLANNNPNEAEANSAARKVCKSLADDSKLKEQAASKFTIQTSQDPRSGDMIIRVSQLNLCDNPRVMELLKALEHEINRPRTWNDVRRSEEPFWRSSRPTSGFNWREESSYNHEQAEKARKEQERYTRREQEQARKMYEEFFRQAGVDAEEFFNVHRKESKTNSRPPKQNLRCKDCGKTIETEFGGPPQMFQCYSCQFDEHNRQGKWAR